MNNHIITISSANQGQVVLPLDVPKLEIVFEEDASAVLSYRVPVGVAVDQDINVIFRGDRSSGEFSGMIEACEGDLVKTRLVISHVGKDTDCIAEIRGAGSGSAVIDCRGMIEISSGATGTDTLYRADFIGLSGSPQIMSIPSLAIHESDIVQASHGSTVGKIDKNQIYYMKTRGISEDKAKEVLVSAFLGKTF